MAQAAAKTPAPAAGKTGAAEPPQVQGVTRREFLNYIWGASIALALAQTTGAVIWFILPVFKAGEFGGAFAVDLSLVPPPDEAPVHFPALRFWLVNIGEKGAQDRSTKETEAAKAQTGQQGLLALYTVCTHLGCLYKWVDINHRFECPCHGSKYHPNGMFIEGPTPRSLDRMIMRFLDASGNELAATEKATGAAVPVPSNTTQIIVETGKIVRGAPHG